MRPIVTTSLSESDKSIFAQKNKKKQQPVIPKDKSSKNFDEVTEGSCVRFMLLILLLLFTIIS